MKVTVEAKIKLELEIEDIVDLDYILQEMDYEFTDKTGICKVENSEWLDYDLKK